MKISVVLPTMNERENVKELCEKFYNLKQLYGDLYEAIFVLNNSTDGTEQVLQNMQNQSGYEFLKIEKSEPGRGAAMRRGVKQAQGDTIVLMDSDGQYDPADIPKLVHPILKGYKLVVPKDYESRSFLRRLYSIGFTKLTKLLLDVEYVQPGFKAGTKEALQDIFEAMQDASGLDVDVRLMNEAVKLGYKISDGEVDAVVYPRKHGKTTFVPIKLALGLFYTALSLAVDRKTGRELPFPRTLKEFTLHSKRQVRSDDMAKTVC
jgi:glycosyltransferase involved in cell wall biosynthesis